MSDTQIHRPATAEDILEMIRGYLRNGAIISALDPNGKILEILPDGSVHGGLHIKFEETSK